MSMPYNNNNTIYKAALMENVQKAMTKIMFVCSTK